MKKTYTAEERSANYAKFMREFHNNPANLVARRSEQKTCSKCNGEGWIKGYEFRDGGKCYSCNGTGRR